MDLTDSERPSVRRLTLIEAYLANDLSQIHEDALRRPEHYSQGHRELLQDLQAKRRTLSSIDPREANDLFLTFYRDTSVAKASEDALSRAKDKILAFEAPEELLERKPFQPPVFEDQVPGSLEPGDKVIV